MRMTYRKLLAVFLAAVVLAACATLPEQRPDDEALRDAAENYWRLILSADYERTYALEDRQDLPPFKDYLDKVKAMTKFRIVGHSIGKVSIEGNEGTVGVEMNVMAPGLQTPVKQFFNDRWRYTKGKWLHVLFK
jgi:ABC-type transporter MlaC component